MSTAINSSQGVSGQTASGGSGPVRGLFSKRDDRSIAEKQLATFEHLLAGFDWKPIETPEESSLEAESGEEVSELEASSKPESTDKEETDRSDEADAEVSTTEDVLLQTEMVATVQADAKSEVETGAESFVQEQTEGEAIVEAVKDQGLNEDASQATLVKPQEKQVEVKREFENETGRAREQVDPRRKDKAETKAESEFTAGPAVAPVQQQSKVEAKSEPKEQLSDVVQKGPTQNVEDVRSNKRSRKERLAENAENPRTELWQQGSPDELTDSNIGSNPENSVKPPEQPFIVSDSGSSQAAPQMVAPLAASNPVLASNAPDVRALDVRGAERSQAVSGPGNSSGPQRAEARSEPATRADETQKNANSRKTEEKSGVDQRQQIRLIQRVARGFERIGEQGGNIRLRLHPPELGSLAMTVRVEGKTLSAEIVTETVQARQALVDNLPQLKQQLADNGLTIERFDVRVMDQQENNSGQAFSGSAFSGQSSSQNGSRESSGGSNLANGRRFGPDRDSRLRSLGIDHPVTGSLASAAGSRSLDVRV